MTLFARYHVKFSALDPFGCPVSKTEPVHSKLNASPSGTVKVRLIWTVGDANTDMFVVLNVVPPVKLKEQLTTPIQ